MSAVEAVTNTAVGYLVALITQLILYPLFSIEVRLDQNFLIAAIFTVVSLIRSYAVRRLFNRG